MRIAVAPIYLHIFAVGRPVPGSLENRLRVAIGQDDRGLVFDFRIDLGLKLLCDRCDVQWFFSFHQPGREVGSITAEIHEGASSIQDWISQPLKEFRLNIDLLRPLMPVVHDDLTKRADSLFLMSNIVYRLMPE